MLISVVTPCFNSAKTIRKTFDSILNQKFKDYEYIIIDGASTDGTVDIIKEYEPKFEGRMRWVSEKDHGIYDAVQKGFSMAKGEVYAWLGSDDVYFPYTLGLVSDILTAHEEVRWMTGEICLISPDDILLEAMPSKYWCYEDFMRGRARFVEQEATFWRSSLWKELKSPFGDYKLAGDYYLWLEFSKRTILYTVRSPLAAFRLSMTQLSFTKADEYIREIDRITEKEFAGFSKRHQRFLRLLWKLEKRPFLYRVVNWLINKPAKKLHALFRKNPAVPQEAMQPQVPAQAQQEKPQDQVRVSAQAQTPAPASEQTKTEPHPQPLPQPPQQHTFCYDRESGSFVLR